MGSTVTVSLHDRALLPEVPRENYSKQRIAQIILATCSTAGLVAIKVISTLEGKEWAETLLSIGIGISAQHAIQEALPRKYTIMEQSFLADHDAEIFLIGTQINANIDLHSGGRKALFAGFNCLFGAGLSAFVHTLVTRKITEQNHYFPLQDSEARVSSSPPMQLITLNEKTTRTAWAAFEVVAGIGLVGLGVSHSSAKMGAGLGVYLAGDGLSQLIGEKTFQWAKKTWSSYVPVGSAIFEDAHYPRKIAAYKIFVENILAIGYLMPGIFLLIASVAEKEQSPVSSYLSYFCSGLLTGFSRHTERVRFTNVPKEHLTELPQGDSRLSLLGKTTHIAKWVFGIVGVGGFIGLGIAGFDVPSWEFKEVAVIDQVALGTFGLALYGSYATGKIAAAHFQKKSSKFWNTLFFHSHYSIGIPFLNLYVMSKMKIGNLALSNSSLIDKVIAGVAYGSLGLGLGFRSAARGEFTKPRVMTAFSAALIGNFIGWELLDETT